ncbi:MAG: hypothetical protein JJE09_02515 [Bacteroidia bacterium]|nr:hypothetical protein [Bacteroidia bacterium]
MNILKVIIILLFVGVIQSCNDKKDYDPDSHLSIKEKDKALMSIIRYLGKAPENVGMAEKFDEKYDAHYLDIASRHQFMCYYIDDEGIHYFLISRPAPSLYEKRVAIGGKLKLDQNGGLMEYEEVFRTWKMLEQDLEVRGLLLFDLMVNGKDLSQYYRTNSTEEYIEFPDEHNYFDKENRRWKAK